jgi:hypothetical protein
MIDIDRLSLTPTKTGRLLDVTRKFELLHFGFVAQWGTFRRAVATNRLLYHEDTSLPKQFLFYFWFSTIESCHVWILIRGHINHLCGHTPTDLRRGIPAPTTSIDDLTVTFTETPRKAAINSRYRSDRDARELEDMLEAQPQRLAMLGINTDSYNAIVWVTSQFL